MRRDNGRNPVGHFVLLRHVVFFDFADLRKRFVELATGEERFEVKEHFTACRMRNPLGDGLAIVSLHGFGFAHDNDLFRREHRHGIAGFDDDIGDGCDVGVGGVQHLLRHRIRNPVAKSLGQELFDSLVLAELVFADERYEHGLLKLDYLKSMISNWFLPFGVTTSTTSPRFLPMRAAPIGLLKLILPLRASASSGETS